MCDLETAELLSENLTGHLLVNFVINKVQLFLFKQSYRLSFSWGEENICLITRDFRVFILEQMLFSDLDTV